MVCGMNVAILFVCVCWVYCVYQSLHKATYCEFTIFSSNITFCVKEFRYSFVIDVASNTNWRSKKDASTMISMRVKVVDLEVEEELVTRNDRKRRGKTVEKNTKKEYARTIA